MSELKTQFAKLRTVSKHERYRRVENATHALACRKYFQEDNYKNVDKKAGSPKVEHKRTTTITEHIIFKRLRNLFEQILLFCTGFVSIVFAAKCLQMYRNHGADYPNLLDGETFIRGGYIKAGALVRHNLFIQIEPEGNPTQKIYTLSLLQDGHHAGSTKLMLFNVSFQSPQCSKCRAVAGVKPVGASYTAAAISQMAQLVYQADDYLNRDFDHPMQITNAEESGFTGNSYAQRTMRELCILH